MQQEADQESSPLLASQTSTGPDGDEIGSENENEIEIEHQDSDGMPALYTGKKAFRSALLIEAGFNTFGGISMIAFPYSVLALMVPSTSAISPLSTTLLQLMGAFVLLLTTPLLAAYPNTVNGIASRPAAYWTLGSGEVFIIGVLAYQWTTAGSSSGLSDKTVFGVVGLLGGTLAARGYALVQGEKWMGRVGTKQD